MIHHEVLRFDVSTDDSLFGKILKDEDDGGCIELTVF